MAESAGHPATREFVESMVLAAFDETRLGVSQKSQWKVDPVAWARDRADIHLWSKQRDVITKVRDHKRVAVHSCHDVGKTFLAATTAGWWLDVHPPGTAFVVSTAPTAPQVKALLWREINRLHARAGLPGRVNLTEWYIDGELVGFGRKPSDYNESAFQGIHAPHVLAIMDEACGVPDNLWIAAETITANVGSRILAIGNPDVPDSTFHQKCKPGSGWEVVHIGYQHTPNFTDEEVPEFIKQQLISPEWVEDMEAEWGGTSGLFTSKILGHFPPDDADPWKVLPFAVLAPCRTLDFIGEDPVEAGIDIGAGGDRTVIVERRGMKLGRIDSYVSTDPMKTVGMLVERINEWDVSRVKVDTIGVGWGIYGRLRELSFAHNPSGEWTHRSEVISVNVAEAPHNPRRFLNKRAEIWWTVGREYSRQQKWDLSNLPEDAVAELTAPRYEIMDSRGKIKIEAKADIKARLRRSPDIADALLLAFYGADRIAPASSLAAFGQSRGLGAGQSASPFGGAGRRGSIFGGGR